MLSGAKPDVWDSGRITSDKSFGVAYSGPELAASTRYYWRVEVWDKDGKPYPPSDISWWETGLLKESWKAQWIGYEDPEHRAVRKSGAMWITNAGNAKPKPTADARPKASDDAKDNAPEGSADTQHDFRYRFPLVGQVRHAHLYVTGKDTPSAWINGKQVLAGHPLPPWKQTPWKSYRVVDVTSNLQQGKNLLAVEVTLYATSTGSSFTASVNTDHPHELLPLP